MTTMSSHPDETLIDDAAMAARLRRAATHRDVVALQVERLRAEVDLCSWTAIGLGLAFTTVNVATFAADGAPAWSAPWLVAWLLDPMVSLLLIAVLRAEQMTSRWRVRTGARAASVKWLCFAATYAMNTWASWSSGSPKGVVLHSIPPMVVLLGAEVAPELRDRLTSASLVAGHFPTNETDEPELAAELASSVLEDDQVADHRVRLLVELLTAGCAVTGTQASTILGCSGRTGRRLLAEARSTASAGAGLHLVEADR